MFESHESPRCVRGRPLCVRDVVCVRSVVCVRDVTCVRDVNGHGLSFVDSGSGVNSGSISVEVKIGREAVDLSCISERFGQFQRNRHG